MKRTYIKQRICHLGGKTKNKKKDFYLFLCWWLDYCLYLQPALLVGKYLKGLEVKYSEEEKEEEEKLFDMPRNNILLQRLQDVDNAPRCTKTRTVTKWLSIFCKILKGQ